MSTKFLGPFISFDSGNESLYRSYANFSDIMTIDSYEGGNEDDSSYAAIKTIPAGYDSGADRMSLIGFDFISADGTEQVPDVDRGYLKFLNRNLINVLTSRPDEVVLPVDYPIGIQTRNIGLYVDYA
jgi:hypothetical protein